MYRLQAMQRLRQLLLPLLLCFHLSLALPLDETMLSRQFVLALLPFASASPLHPDSLQSRAVSLDSYIASESTIAYNNAFANIGSRAGAKPGIIVASPSTTDPDYVYTWTRDSALTTHGLLEVSTAGSQTSQTLAFVNDYITAQQVLQGVSNPSGSLADLSGLGEPKFNIDETAFTGPWGRPQRDGPALRARALMKYVELHASSISASQQNTIDTLIKNDLDYTVKYWNQTGFDLWEEVNGSSFFTTLSQFHALALGSNYFASSDSTRSKSYFTESQRVRCFADSFWAAGSNKAAYSSNINLVNGNNGRSGLDANSVIAAQLYPSSPSPAYTTDPCSTAFFSPCSDRMLASTYAVVESFRGLYPINSARESAGSRYIAIGRYREDTYYNGNPWHLTTLAPAEQMYRAISIWNQYGQLSISSTSLPFFQSLVPAASVGTYKKGDGNFEKVTAAVAAYADGFVSIVQQYTPSNGSLWEQFSKSNGTSTSARDLTWSYIAFLTTTHYRSLQNTATAPNTSNVLFGNPANVSCPAAPSAPAGTVPVNFKVTKQTAYGQEIYVAGNQAALGSWDLSKAVHLSANAYTASNPVWQTAQSVNLPQSTTFQYKYVLKNTDGSYTYENGNNRQYTTPATGSTSLADTWQN
ncbi:uncharacterized protein JCM15063_002845 [Sporobolomyces koalae]|uniref:uncharacterized protein n=1 Tax=Sporobolomyces koalae TaxID=500713 RepID=UPI00317D7F17